MRAMRSLQLTSPLMRGDDVTRLQGELKRRGRVVTVDGSYGPETAAAVHVQKFRLGFPLKALDTGASLFFLRILFGQRPAPHAYTLTSRARLKRVAKAQGKRSKAARAVDIACANEGATEHPAGSNRGPGWIDVCQVNAGHGRFAPGEQGWPWCGCSVHEAFLRAGVRLPGEIRSVGWLYNAARAGLHGFHVVPLDQADVGDIVILFGPNTHMGLVRGRFSGTLPTREANTSPPNGSGSQDNGGGLWDRTRNSADVVLVVRVTV